jgi:magnesium chelatase subunit D
MNQTSTALYPQPTPGACSFPFAAIVGMDEAKRALMLLAVDESLKGILIATGSGAIAGPLVNSLRPVWPAHPPVVNVPVNVSEDRLLGGVDFERAVAGGRAVLSDGLLASADSGLLVIDSVNLLDAAIASFIAEALDAEVVRTEREGISATSPARFSMIGTYAAEEGEPVSLIRERVGMIVEYARRSSPPEIEEATHRALRFEEDPRAFIERYEPETAAICETIEAARLRLSSLNLTREELSILSGAALALGVEGNRADLFAMRAARASAALAGRDAVCDEDLVTAIRLVLLPRATRRPESRQSLNASDTAPPDRPDQSREEEMDSGGYQNSESRRFVDDLILQAMDSPAPEFRLDSQPGDGRRARTGRRARAKHAVRGRYWRSALRAGNSKKVAVDATLRAAAPLQHARQIGRGEAQTTGRRRMIIKPEDLRFKQHNRRSGILFIFAVDASGSMRVNRMAQAKGALTRLLEQAYLHRDKVALISFRRAGAEILLAPTRSIELAKRSVDCLPAGGATPLAAGLMKALELARSARLREAQQVVLLIFTDGRANVGLGNEPGASSSGGEINDELRRIGAALLRERIKSVVVDTRLKFASGGAGAALADLLGGSYVYLPRADASAVYSAVNSEAALLRQENYANR